MSDSREQTSLEKEVTYMFRVLRGLDFLTSYNAEQRRSNSWRTDLEEQTNLLQSVCLSYLKTLEIEK